jgi:hypothetical protein
VAVLALTAVPALGITHLGSDLLTGWAGGSEEQAALASAGPLTLDAPASNFNRLKAQEKEATTQVALAQEASLQLNGWQYTATNNSQLLAFQLLINAYLLNNAPPQVYETVVLFALIFNFFNLTPTPSASPSR